MPAAIVQFDRNPRLGDPRRPMRRLHSSLLDSAQRFTRGCLPPLAMAFVALFASPSCKSRGGDTCSGTAEACADEHTKLICRHDRYQAVKCDAPKGCKLDGDKARCDFSGNKPGTDCDESILGRRMCRNDKSALGCRDNKYAIHADIEYEYEGQDTIVEVRRCFEYCKNALLS